MTEHRASHDELGYNRIWFWLQISSCRRKIISIPILEEICLGVEVLPRETERSPERCGAGLIALILVRLCRHSFVWEVWRLAAAAIEPTHAVGATVGRVRGELDCDATD